MGSAGRAGDLRLAAADDLRSTNRNGSTVRLVSVGLHAHEQSRAYAPRPSVSSSLRCSSCASRARRATPGFWEAATQADFLRGEVEQLSIDEHGRLMLGPEVRRVHDRRRAVRLDAAAGPDGVVVSRHRQRRQGHARRSQTATARCSSTAPRWKCTRSPPAPGRRALRRHLARRPHLQGRCARQATPFFDPDDKYIWALAVDAEGRGLRRRPATRATVYRITPDGKGAPFFATKTTHAVVAGVRCQTDSCWSAPARRAACSASTPQGKGFLLLDTPYQEVEALRVDPKGVALRRRAERPAAQGGDTTPMPPDAERRRPRPVPTRVDRDHLDRHHRRPGDAAAARRRRRRPAIGAVRPARSTACCPTASGISSGSRATTRRTTSRSTPTARCSSPPAAAARSSGSPAIRCGRRC